MPGRGFTTVASPSARVPQACSNPLFADLESHLPFHDRSECIRARKSARKCPNANQSAPYSLVIRTSLSIAEHSLTVGTGFTQICHEFD